MEKHKKMIIENCVIDSIKKFMFDNKITKYSHNYKDHKQDMKIRITSNQYTEDEHFNKLALKLFIGVILFLLFIAKSSDSWASTKSYVLSGHFFILIGYILIYFTISFVINRFFFKEKAVIITKEIKRNIDDYWDSTMQYRMYQTNIGKKVRR